MHSKNWNNLHEIIESDTARMICAKIDVIDELLKNKNDVAGQFSLPEKRDEILLDLTNWILANL